MGRDVCKDVKKKETFSEEVRKSIWLRDGSKCIRCEGTDFLSIHHLVENRVYNIKIFGNKRIQSEENGVLVCGHCHDHHSLWDKERKKALIIKWGNEDGRKD